MLIHRLTLRKARELGAECSDFAVQSICSSEGDRIDAFPSEMICAETVEEREAALAKILRAAGRLQKLYEALEGNPVTIRFLDHRFAEFVPYRGRGHQETG